ncbi:MAG: hypothetical protein R3272_11440 [Candidatus Promineifilaceae bacterium]|nr:hypothetical protein [Candidatus Promineifilaceae bacterium]
MIKGAFYTVATLFGGLLIGLLVGDLVFRLIPGSSVENVQIGHAAIAAIPALAGFLAGGAAWGIQMGRLAGVAPEGSRRMALAGMAGFAPITIVLALVLGVAEPFIVASFGTVGEGVPIHRVFTLLFVPSAFLIAGISAYAVGRTLGDGARARSLLWQVGLAAAAAFLLVNLTMEALGWVVGAPGAAERATMVTVMAAGNLAAALAGGAVLGARLAERRQTWNEPRPS